MSKQSDKFKAPSIVFFNNHMEVTPHGNLPGINYQNQGIA